MDHATRTGEMHFYASMNSEQYCVILHYMIRTLQEQFEDKPFYIIHDNASFAKSKETKAYLENNGLTMYLIPFPTYTQDGNIIENPWAIVKRRVRKEITQAINKTREDLDDSIATKWNEMEPEIIQNLYRNLPRRMTMIIESKGQLIGY